MNNQETNGSEELVTIDNSYWVEQHKALKRLEANADFKAVMLEGYFKDVAVNTVSMLANDYTRQQGLRGELFEKLVGISGVQDHFAMVHNLGTIAEDEQLEADGLED